MDTINDHSLLKGILRTRKYYWGSKNQFLAPCKLSFGDLGPNHKSCKQCWNKIQKLSLQWLCAYSCFLFLKHIISICVNANEHSQKIIVVLLWFMLHVKEVWFSCVLGIRLELCLFLLSPIIFCYGYFITCWEK